MRQLQNDFVDIPLISDFHWNFHFIISNILEKEILLNRGGQNTRSARTRTRGIRAPCEVNSKELMFTNVSEMQYSFTMIYSL